MKLLASLALLALALVQVAAQDPIGSYSECGPGRTYRIQCYVSTSGYLTDVVYRNTVPPADIAICNVPQQQLQQSVMTQLEISASDSFIRMLVYEDDWGVRGMAMDTQLGERLECGSTDGKPTVYSSRSTYPLGGFTGSCAANGAPALPRSPQGHANQHQSHGSGHNVMSSKQQKAHMHVGQHADSSTRVTRVFGACWNTQPSPQSAACPPGAGTNGGGQACIPCGPGTYSPGGRSPCLMCPQGLTTIAPASSACGCFPGQGVYGPELYSPEVCEECPAGTYAIGGALAPCQPCTTNAFEFLTSAAGSTSIADCACAAGFGSTDANPKVCSTCPLGTFNVGPLPRAVEQPTGLAGRAGGPGASSKTSSSSSSSSASSSSSSSSSINKSRVGSTLAALAADSSSSSNEVNPGTLLMLEATPGHLGTNSPSSSTTVSVAATSSALYPQQFLDSWGFLRNSGVNPVFYEPTYDPCTACGPACWTDSPGSTSPDQCICSVPIPAPPAPPAPPSPPPSPQPPPSPGPSPSPSPSPPPTSPSPSPPPTSSCVTCDLTDLSDWAALCAEGTDIFLLDYCDPNPALDIGILTATTTPINILFDDTDVVDCIEVSTNGGQTTNLNIGLLPGNNPPSTCTMPGPIAFVIPAGVTARSGSGSGPGSGSGSGSRSGSGSHQRPALAAPAPAPSPEDLREVEQPWTGVVEPEPPQDASRQDGNPDQGSAGAQPEPQIPDNNMQGEEGFMGSPPEDSTGLPGDQGLPMPAMPLQPDAAPQPGDDSLDAGFNGAPQLQNPAPGSETQPPVVNRPWPGDGVWAPVDPKPSLGDNGEGAQSDMDGDMLQDVGADGLPGEQGTQQQPMLQPGFLGGVGQQNPVVWSPVVLPGQPPQLLKRPSRPTIG